MCSAESPSFDSDVSLEGKTEIELWDEILLELDLMNLGEIEGILHFYCFISQVLSEGDADRLEKLLFYFTGKLRLRIMYTPKTGEFERKIILSLSQRLELWQDNLTMEIFKITQVV